MSGLRLALKVPLPAPADFTALTAAGWDTADAGTMAARTVRVERDTVPVGELFSIGGSAGPELVLTGDLSFARGVGAGLTAGRLLVEGNVGDDAGLAMAGGLLTVRGNAGFNAGGAAPGAKRGMTGGELVILGSAGAEAGAAMRRGLVAVGGAVGQRAGRAALAGTVFAGGDVGDGAGLFSKRGSLVTLGRVAPSPTWRDAGLGQPIILRLLLKRLAALGLAVTAAHIDGRWRRWSGDFAESGRGEIVQWMPA